MKEDYLWDKTGEDAQLERLENALKAFRYHETAPPALPQKVFTIEKRFPKPFLRFLFPAFAAGAATIVIFSVVWFQLAGRMVSPVDTVGVDKARQTADDSASAPPDISVPPDISAPVDPFEQTEPSAQIEPAAEKKSFRALKTVKIRRSGAPVARRERAAASSKKPIDPAEALTEEERHAYDQLMLALSIAGSKLKIVQDRINGIEEQNAAVESSGR